MSAASAAWFVDGSYLYKTWKSLQLSRRLDYLKLRQQLEKEYQATIEDAYYFNADPDPPSSQSNSFHSFLTKLPPRGPGLRVKLYWLSQKKLFWPADMGGEPVTHPRTGVQYELTQQKAVDVGLAFHLVRSFSKRRWNKLFLSAGDGDFHEVLQYLVETENVDVYLIGSPDNISSEIRPYARELFDLRDHIEQISQS